jgi:hypothetical protein
VAGPGDIGIGLLLLVGAGEGAFGKRDCGYVGRFLDTYERRQRVCLGDVLVVFFPFLFFLLHTFYFYMYMTPPSRAWRGGAVDG